MRNINNMNIVSLFDRGFILVTTLIMMILFAVIALAMYQQSEIASQSIQVSIYKNQAEDAARKALDTVQDSLSSTSSGTIGKTCVKKKNENDQDNVNYDPLACESLKGDVINDAVVKLRKGDSLSGIWSPVSVTGIGIGGTSNAKVYQATQNLGESEDGVYVLFRTTIVAQFLDAISVVESIYASPTQTQN